MNRLNDLFISGSFKNPYGAAMSGRLILFFILFTMACAVPRAHAQEIRYPPSTGCAEFHVRTPDMRGRTVASMREQYAGFKYRVTGRRHSDEYARGRIVSQRPPPDECVMFNATLDVTLSLGPRCYEVPRVSPDDLRRGAVSVGPRRAQVRLRLEEVESGRPRGTILRQRPGAGACPRQLPELITVTVSRGPPPCLDIPRLDAADAERGFVLLGDRRVPVQVTRRHSQRHESGEVILQKPEAGACVREIGGIVLVLSAGPGRPPPGAGGGALDRTADFVGRYWPGILAVLAGLVLMSVAAPGKTPPPPDPARFAVRPRIDPGTQTASVPERIEGGRRDG